MLEISNLTTVRVGEGFIKKIGEVVFKQEKVKEGADVSLAFIGPGRMRKLNSTYRKKNRVTDVLSFPENKVAFENFKIGPLKKTRGLGEIVICLREVKKNARRLKVSFQEELARVFVHGLLHLLGYDHKAVDKAGGIMQKKEEEYLKVLKKQGLLLTEDHLKK